MGKGDDDRIKTSVQNRRRRQTSGKEGELVNKMEDDNGMKDKGLEESRRLTVRKGMPDLDDRKTGDKSRKVRGNVRKFVNILEEKIQLKQKNIYSYFSVFGPNKKTLTLFDETLCDGENGHQ